MILPTAYLAPINWYEQLKQNDCQIEIYESFPKQTLRNRTVIADANGVQTLTIPVQKCESKQLTKDVRICYQTKWQHTHWQAMKSAYKNTPFYDYYQDFFAPFYFNKQFTFLLDFNTQLHQTVMQLLQMQCNSPLTTDWQQQTNIDAAFQTNNNKTYYQIFADKNGFQHNLSIVDLLFNMGNEAILYL